MVGVVGLACAWVVLGLAFRVAEAPGGGAPFNLAELQAGLANPELNRPGQKIREALAVANERERTLAARVNAGQRVRDPWADSYREQLPRVIEQGWAAATPPFQQWLGSMTAGQWPEDLGAAVQMPPGVYIDPRAVVAGQADSADALKGARLLTARALQLQAGGRDENALDHLVTVLALSRHLRHRAPAYAHLDGLEAEREALAGLDHWLTKVGRRPQLLRRALTELGRHEAALTQPQGQEVPAPPVMDALASEYLRCRLNLGNTVRPGSALSGETEAMLMQVPWEGERARRLADAVFAGRKRLAEAGAIVPPENDGLLADWVPGAGGPSPERLARLVESSWVAGSLTRTAALQREAQFGLCRVRAARLQAALALYQCEHGQAAPSLAALVPAVLPELPEDPFAHEPFRYRVSKGEKGEVIAWTRQLAGGGAEFVRHVPAGQGILWSVGPDGSDDGGARQWFREAMYLRGCDVIFLVPGPPGQ
jgi:hypothetical protein